MHKLKTDFRRLKFDFTERQADKLLISHDAGNDCAEYPAHSERKLEQRKEAAREFAFSETLSNDLGQDEELGISRIEAALHRQMEHNYEMEEANNAIIRSHAINSLMLGELIREANLAPMEHMALLLEIRGGSIRVIGKCLGRSKSTVQRDLRSAHIKLKSAAGLLGGFKHVKLQAQMHSIFGSNKPVTWHLSKPARRNKNRSIPAQ